MLFFRILLWFLDLYINEIRFFPVKIVQVPNEIGSLDPLRGYQGEDIEIQLPGNLTVYDIDWLAVWCVEYRHNFGHVYIPKDLDVPPALGQTKIAVIMVFDLFVIDNKLDNNSCNAIMT